MKEKTCPVCEGSGDRFNRASGEWEASACRRCGGKGIIEAITEDSATKGAGTTSPKATSLIKRSEWLPGEEAELYSIGASAFHKRHPERTLRACYTRRHEIAKAKRKDLASVAASPGSFLLSFAVPMELSSEKVARIVDEVREIISREARS